MLITTCLNLFQQEITIKIFYIEKMDSFISKTCFCNHSSKEALISLSFKALPIPMLGIGKT